MAKKHKPKKHPQPSLSLEEARNQAKNQAIDFMGTILFTALCDACNKDAEFLKVVWEKAEKYSQEIVEGRINIKEMAKVLRDEYQIDTLDITRR